ncbi:hypothetical protein P7K49_040489, partial [Saguinus oedipus]
MAPGPKYQLWDHRAQVPALGSQGPSTSSGITGPSTCSGITGASMILQADPNLISFFPTWLISPSHLFTMAPGPKYQLWDH